MALIAVPVDEVLFTVFAHRHALDTVLPEARFNPDRLYPGSRVLLHVFLASSKVAESCYALPACEMGLNQSPACLNDVTNSGAHLGP